MALTNEPTELPDLDALERCLTLLSERTNEPGTLDLHDPLYLMKRDADPGQLQELWSVMSVHSSHPSVPQIRQILAPWLPLMEQDLASVLRQDAPIPEGALIPWMNSLAG